MLITIIIWGILLFVVLYALSRFIKLIPLRKSYSKGLLRVFPFIELSAWLVFIYLSARRFADEEKYSELIIILPVILILVIFSWFFIKDFIAGVFLRSEGTLSVGQRVKLNDIEGSIDRLGSRSMVVTNARGEQVKLPYSLVSGKVISFLKNKYIGLEQHSFELELVNDRPQGDYLSLIREKVLLNALTVSGKPPKISMISSGDDSYTFKIEFYSFSTEHAYRAESEIRESMSAKKI